MVIVQDAATEHYKMLLLLLCFPLSVSSRTIALPADPQLAVDTSFVRKATVAIETALYSAVSIRLPYLPNQLTGFQPYSSLHSLVDNTAHFAKNFKS